ncbi:MAG: hypothetical protein Q7W44_06620 [Coriobacteriia bacterium]|nr:hypothetical protein [Coriobacteriia bacterium]
METLKAIGRGVLIVVVGLALLAGTLYLFGGMWVRTPEMREAFDAQVAAGEAEPVEGRFVIPIPGCVCHSDSPELQARHAERRINECAGCHGQ